MTTGTQLRDQGQADVLAADAAIHRGVTEDINAAIADLISEGREFTADDIRERLPADFDPHSDNLLPAVIGSLAARDRIRAVGHRRCTRPSRRAGWMRIWAGGREDRKSVV